MGRQTRSLRGILPKLELVSFIKDDGIIDSIHVGACRYPHLGRITFTPLCSDTWTFDSGLGSRRPSSIASTCSTEPSAKWAALEQDASAADVGSLYDFDFSAIKKHDCTAPDKFMLSLEVYMGFCPVVVAGMVGVLVPVPVLVVVVVC